MQRTELVVAALAASGARKAFTPVQVQKLFFLLDREAPHLFSGPHFDFQPYDYGPFDRAVYIELDNLSATGMVQIENSGRVRRYCLTNGGMKLGEDVLLTMSNASRDYLQKLSEWIAALSFQQLVSAVYLRHPDMKVNSVFQE